MIFDFSASFSFVVTNAEIHFYHVDDNFSDTDDNICKNWRQINNLKPVTNIFVVNIRDQQPITLPSSDIFFFPFICFAAFILKYAAVALSIFVY